MTHDQSCIRLRGVRHNNLKNFDLDLPLGKLVVVTGLSGSGKSSLAFDTLFAEGQRRYIETFSPYARQFFDRMDKPQVDRIDGIPPAIAIEQRNSVKTTRSTVGTMTEICEYLKVLWAHTAQLYCRSCQKPVRKDSPLDIWNALRPGNNSESASTEVLITFDLPLSNKLSLSDSLQLVARQGYQRLCLDGNVLRLEDALPLLHGQSPDRLTVVQDRLKLTVATRARFAEACEHAYHFGKGHLCIHDLTRGVTHRFSCHLHCAACNIEYRPPVAALFSFNHPVGACPTCRGFGRVIAIDYDRALPDRGKTLSGGAIKPWQTGHGLESQKDMLTFCRRRKVPVDVPFSELSAQQQQWIIEGEPGYGKDEDHEWPHAWYGVKGYFRWLESKAYKMHVRVLLARYRAYSTCLQCSGQRFQPESLLYKIDCATRGRLNLADLYQLPVTAALEVVEQLAAAHSGRANDPLGLALSEVRSRLGYLIQVGLGYLTLDRPTRSLSGGETERVNLTTCLGTRLVNTLYVLDEPSVGLHPRDTQQLVRVLHDLRDLGNTVVVVEHESSVMRAADQIIDLGPGHGESGGHLVFQGTFPEILTSEASLTGRYLSGAKTFPPPPRRPVIESDPPRLSLAGMRCHNLDNLAVEIPLQRLVCLTGVSGSGKTTLARDILLPALQERLQLAETAPVSEANGESDSDTDVPESSSTSTLTLRGADKLRGVILIDQAALGKTPRSNPAVYIGAFDHIRDLFAHTDLARQRGLNSSAFSFNSGQGQCERCRGAGFEKIEMQFLSDVFIRCAECNGRRYRPHILEIKLAGSFSRPGAVSEEIRVEWSIADLLEATVDDALLLLISYYHLPAGRRALEGLKLLQEVGLGYLRLGQPVTTLSGGECQRLKLVKHLAEFAASERAQFKPTLLIFDEPTTGLHFEDVRILLQVFQRIVDAGHSLLVIEHNLDVIRAADWVIDLGPEGGAAGGQLVAQGTPEIIAACQASHTGAALRSGDPKLYAPLASRRKPRKAIGCPS